MNVCLLASSALLLGSDDMIPLLGTQTTIPGVLRDPAPGVNTQGII